MRTKKMKGFTLVELLIVIALLGALAIGLIGALDPFEQLKKGQDTGTRDLVNQVQTAVLRHYATTNAMPWAATTAFSGTALTTAELSAAISNMVVSGELKSNFNEIYNAAKREMIKVTYTPPDDTTGTSRTVSVCYKPDSKSFQVDPNTRYNLSGVEGLSSDSPHCKSFLNVAGTTKDCYWCVQ